METTNAGLKYPSLNGLRALSIVFVVIHHLNIIEHVYGTLYEYTWLCPLLEFLQDGQMGVNVFFVISGFLITSLLMREQQENKSISLKNFYARRTLRIFPAYYFLLLVYFILQALGYIYISGPSWLSAITYTKYFNWGLDWYTAHAWSLSIEEHFYLLWPLVFLMGPAARKIFAFTLIAAVPLIRLYLHHYPVDWIDEMSIFTRIDAVATGCLFAIYREKIVRVLERRWRMIFFISALCFFFLRYIPRFAQPLGLDVIFIPFGLTFGTFANLLVAVIMLYSMFGPKGPWFRFLNLKIMDYIGLLSYSIYLWQQVFISGTGNWATKFPQNILFIVLAALFSYHLIEKPFLTLKTKFQSRSISQQ